MVMAYYVAQFVVFRNVITASVAQERAPQRTLRAKNVSCKQRTLVASREC